MTDKKQKFLQYSFFFFLFFTIYYSFVWSVLPFFVDPRLHRFEKYHSLWNWDLSQHAIGDYDGDGKEDLISFTGCAFLSASNTSEIPETGRCIASGITTIFFPGEENLIGQKYILTDLYDLSLEALDKGSLISHSYLGKDEDKNWQIYINENGNFRTYEIERTSRLIGGSQVTFVNQVDELLYSISRLFVFFALPLVPLSFILTPLFESLRLTTYQVPIYEIVTLSSITAILYLLWTRATGSGVRGEHLTTDQLAKILWDYNKIEHRLQKSDAILVLGSHDTRVAERGVELFLQGLAPYLIFSGNIGRLTKGVFPKSEAEIFADIAIQMGVPKSKIIIEDKSTNTGENIIFTRRLLEKKGFVFQRVIAVHKPYMGRRTYATFKKQWPGVDILVTAPQISFEGYPNDVISKDEVINIMVGDTQRVKVYAQKGFQIAQTMPALVWSAYEELVRRGFTEHVIEE